MFSETLLSSFFQNYEPEFELDIHLLYAICLVNWVQSAFVRMGDVFLCCIIKALRSALMMFSEPVATSLCEDSFAV